MRRTQYKHVLSIFSYSKRLVVDVKREFLDAAGGITGNNDNRLAALSSVNIKQRLRLFA
jgi:hypothetical protein